jgi:hypothetical protein
MTAANDRPLRDRLGEALSRLSGLHDRMAEEAGIKRATVICATCGRSASVDGAHCLRHGWPKCCGYTMRLARPTPPQDGA